MNPREAGRAAAQLAPLLTAEQVESAARVLASIPTPEPPRRDSVPDAAGPTSDAGPADQRAPSRSSAVLGAGPASEIHA